MANRLQLRRGDFDDIAGAGPYQSGEPLFAEDRNALYIGRDGTSSNIDDPVRGGLNYILNTWDNDTTYEENHIVKFNGVFYRARAQTIGSEPASATDGSWERISFSQNEIDAFSSRIDDPTLVHLNVTHGNFSIGYTLVDALQADTNVLAALTYNPVSNLGNIAVLRTTDVNAGTFTPADGGADFLVSLSQGGTSSAAITDEDSNGEIWIVQSAENEGSGNTSHVNLTVRPWPLARRFATSAGATEVVDRSSDFFGRFYRQGADTSINNSVRIFTPDTNASANVFFDAIGSASAGHPVLSTTKPAFTESTLPSTPAAGDSLILSRPFLSQMRGIGDSPVGTRFKLATVPLTRSDATSQEILRSSLELANNIDGGTTLITDGTAHGEGFVALYNVNGTENIFSPAGIANESSYRVNRAAAKTGDHLYFGPRDNSATNLRRLTESRVCRVKGPRIIAQAGENFQTAPSVLAVEPLVDINNSYSTAAFNPFNLNALSRVSVDETVFDTYGPATRHANRITASVTGNTIQFIIPPNGADAPNNPQSGNGLVSEILDDFTTLRTADTRPRWIGFYNGDTLQLAVYSEDNEALDVVAGASGNSFNVRYATSQTKTVLWSRSNRTTGATLTIDNIRIARGSNTRLPLPTSDGHDESYNHLPFVLFSSAGNRYNLTDSRFKWFYDCHISLDEGLATYDGINWRQ